MSAHNHRAVKAWRRLDKRRRELWHDAYRHASFITAWCCMLSGNQIMPNRERRRGHVTHSRRPNFWPDTPASRPTKRKCTTATTTPSN